MNKCYGALIMLLTVNTVLFSMKTNIIRYVVSSALIGGGSYVLDKEITKYAENAWEDAPQNVQQWARKNLIEKGIKNADTVPLKMGPLWSAERSFIAVEQSEARELENCFMKQEMDDEDRKKEIFAQEMLFHEAQHYQNSDYGKRRLVYGLTSGILFLPHASVPRLLLKAAMVVGANIAYIRHQELEADRFALMNVPIENLETCKFKQLQWAEAFEDYVLNDPFAGLHSGIKMRIGFLLSKRLHSLNQQALSVPNNSNKLLHIQRQKDILIGLVDFLHDYRHPRYWRHVALVQECMDKRKE
jgi:hypothetical protein